MITKMTNEDAKKYLAEQRAVSRRRATAGSAIVPLGTKTRWGKVEGVQSKDGERYYFLVDSFKNTAYMPADVVEKDYLPNDMNQFHRRKL
jgi:hypothetical protein